WRRTRHSLSDPTFVWLGSRKVEGSRKSGPSRCRHPRTETSASVFQERITSYCRFSESRVVSRSNCTLSDFAVRPANRVATAWLGSCYLVDRMGQAPGPLATSCE